MTAEFDAIMRFMERGGDILWLILAAAVLLFTLLIERCWYLRFTFPAQKKTLLHEWQAIVNKQSWTAQRIREQMLSKAKLDLEGLMGLIKVLVALSPMLGLLGTVVGMIQLFDVMMKIGTGNARAMAGGVSIAMISTMAGMVVAVTGLFFTARIERANRAALNRFADVLAQEAA